MKKITTLLLAATLSVGMLTGCAQEAASSEATSSAATSESAATAEGDAAAEPIAVEKLTVGFVPSRDPDEIVTATEPLKEMLTTELAALGYEVGEVEITVGTDYEVVGEGLDAGTIDIGLIPGGTYVLYDEGADVILTATRSGLSIDDDNPVVWNENKPTTDSDEMAVSYRSLIIAGPTEKGQELADKVNAGEELTWDDINSANWSVMSTTSPAGYIYPSLWLQENYEMSITDLANASQVDSYGSAFARLAAGQTDVMVIYADARRDNEDKWMSDFGREASIWDETNVIGVTPAIYNDTISVSKQMDADLAAAVAQAFINIGNTPEGQEVISIYNHAGYQAATSADYDAERAAQELIRQLNAAG